MKFVFDLDGTICFKGKPVSEKILTCLENICKNGHEVIFASARPIRDMLPVIHTRFHEYTLIGGNGSLISQKGKLIYSKEFEKAQLEEILSLIYEFQATYLIDGDWDYAYTGPGNHSILNNLDPAKLAKSVPITSLNSVVKILILTANNMEELSQRLNLLDIVVHKHGNENVLDISPKGIHKWNALRILGVEEGKYVAFGNDANDISMFEHAAYSVMVGHHPELAPFAKESISMDTEYEIEIINRLEELSKLYSLSHN
ncbi:HAD family hydrolase [Bacillus pseudomycoides]|nr:HAD family hydrolase [Bacillus pseudomycoides]